MELNYYDGKGIMTFLVLVMHQPLKHTAATLSCSFTFA